MTSAKAEPAEGNSRKPLIVAAIPCFNEERFIGSVVLSVKKYVDKVVVVDDGSMDASAEVARDAGAVVRSHGLNKGYGAAIRTALNSGKEEDADVLVIIDGDGQHKASDIPRLVNPVLEGEADVAVGSRFLGKGMDAPLYRRLGQRVLNLATNVGSGRKLSDSQSGFRAYSAEALRMLSLTENGMSVTSEMQFAIANKGLKVAEVPIGVSYSDRAKRNPIGHGLNVLSRVLVLLSLRQPMIIFGVPGLALLGGGIAMGLHVLDVYAQTRQLGLGNAMMTVLLTLAGMLCLFAAVILQAIKELLRGAFTQLEREAGR